MKKNKKKVDDSLARSPIMRRRRIETMLWARLDELEKEKPCSLDAALAMARQSRRLRRWLGKFVRLKLSVSPSHALLVDLWGKEVLLRTGALKQMRRFVEDFDSVRNAGFRVINLEKMLDGEESVEEVIKEGGLEYGKA